MELNNLSLELRLLIWLRDRVTGVKEELDRMYNVLDVPFLTEEEKKKFELIEFLREW